MTQNIPEIIAELDRWWYLGEFSTGEALCLQGALQEYVEPSYVEEEQSLSVFPEKLRTQVQRKPC